MIYQLIQRDPAWKFMPWLAIVSAVAWVCPRPLGQFGPLITVTVLFGVARLRATRFEAALPIEASDLLLKRILSLMALIWIPALAGAAGIVLAKGLSAQAEQPLQVAALCTLTAAVAQTVRLKDLAGPKWTLFPMFLVVPVVTGMMILEHPVPPLVPPFCALAGTGLFVWAWVAVPRSFQLSGAGVKSPGVAQQVGIRAPRATFRWAPVVRSVCSWRYVFFVSLMGFQTAVGQWLVATIFVFIVWPDARTRIRWLWALPVGRRALLWTQMGPILAAHALGYLASFRFFGRTAPIFEPRVVVVTLTAFFGCVMLTILFCVLVDWREFARIPRRILNAVCLLPLAIWSVAIFTKHGDMWARNVLAQLGRTVSMSLPALIATAAAILIALYLAVEKVFNEPDFADKPKVNQSGAFA